jgi:rRNA processing protein Krr1/Pno1
VAAILRAGDRVVGPGGRARIHFADLQTARVHVPNVSILAQVRVVESAVALRERRNVILDEHRFAQSFFVDRLVGNR